MLPDSQISYVYEARIVLASHWERPAAHDGKADGGLLEKLDLSDETIVGVGQMTIAADIVPYSGVICALAKREEIPDRHRYSPRKQTSVASLETRSCLMRRSVYAIRACLGSWRYNC